MPRANRSYNLPRYVAAELTTAGYVPLVAPEPVAPDPDYAIALTVGAHGTVATSPPGLQQRAGTVVTLTATPAEGYVFAGWTVDGVSAGAGATLDVTMDADHTVAAAFAVAAPDALLADSFDRADGAVGSADTGQAWTSIFHPATIASGTLATSGSLAAADAGAEDVDLTVTLVATNHSAVALFGSNLDVDDPDSPDTCNAFGVTPSRVDLYIGAQATDITGFVYVQQNSCWFDLRDFVPGTVYRVVVTDNHIRFDIDGETVVESDVDALIADNFSGSHTWAWARGTWVALGDAGTATTTWDDLTVVAPS